MSLYFLSIYIGALGLVSVHLFLPVYIMGNWTLVHGQEQQLTVHDGVLILSKVTSHLYLAVVTIPALRTGLVGGRIPRTESDI